MLVSKAPPPSARTEYAELTANPTQISTKDKQTLSAAVSNAKKVITGFGEDLQQLSPLERGSLRPVFAVLKETLEELNGDPDDESVMNPNKQGQLKELSFALEVHERQFNAYTEKSKKNNTDSQAYRNLCKTLATICKELANSVKAITNSDSD